MTFLNTTARTSRPRDHDRFQPTGRLPALFGLFVGFVKNADDVQRNGRLSVWIPEFGSAPEERQGWITVSYCSPFAGATNVDSIDRNNRESFEGTQTSYGMWMVPPDINNEVLVMFVNGDPGKGIWIGSLYNQFMNQMVPGVAADARNWGHPGKPVPVAEYNKWDTSAANPDRTVKPVHQTRFRGLGNQGLIRDRRRGILSSSARRESPSQVYGILTPGPAIDPNAPATKIRRKGGSSLVMDDGVGTEHIQLMTKSGAQIKIDETDGFIYVINRDGTGWVQIDQNGNIDIFGAGDTSIRAGRDFNVRADRNVNIEAGQNVFIKAAGDTVEGTETFTHDVNNVPKTIKRRRWTFVGEGKGAGGNVVTEAARDLHSTAANSAFLTARRGDYNLLVNGQISSTTVSGGQDIVSNLGVKITTAGSLDVAADGTIRIGATDHVSLSSSNNVNLCSKNRLSLNGDNSVAIKSLTEVGVTGQTIFSSAVWANEDLAVRRALKSASSGSLTEKTSKKAVEPNPAQCPQPGITADGAKTKATREHLDILGTWRDTDKFIRNSQSVESVVSRMPTFEPCPLHDNFKQSQTTGYTSGGPNDYAGSGGPGNEQASQPAQTTPPSASPDSTFSDPSSLGDTLVKDFDWAAFKNQLVINEGYRDRVYRDTKNLLTSGIGHLLIAPSETSRYPMDSPVSVEQIDRWYQEDATLAVRGAIDLVTPAVWDELSDVRKRALADLCYNLGKNRLGKFVNFLAAIKKSDWPGAGRELQNSAWFGQVKSRGPRIVTMITNNTDPHQNMKK